MHKWESQERSRLLVCVYQKYYVHSQWNNGYHSGSLVVVVAVDGGATGGVNT